jgi:hypothetical protein
MFIHSLVCVFLYVGFGASDISYVAALLFAFNPSNNQVSVWIAGRAYALSALSLLMAMSIPILGPIFILFGAYFNAGFITPLLLLLTKAWWVALLMPIIWAIHWTRFKRNVGHKIAMEAFEEDKAWHPRKLVLFTKTMGFYFVNGIIPVKTTFYHSFLQSAAGSGKKKAYTMNCRWFWLGVCVFIGSALYLTLHKWDMSNFALVWWFFCMAQFGNIFRIHQEIAERYMYQPNVGLMFFLSSLIVAHPVIVAGVIACYATKMWFYMDAFQDDYFLTEYSNLNSPDAWFGWHVKAMKRWELKSYQEAVILWSTALQISPEEFKLNLNLATALHMGGHKPNALKLLERAEKSIVKGQEDQAKKLLKEWKEGNMGIVL